MSEENKSNEEELVKLKEKLEKQEDLLIEQEHRFFKVLQTFFIKRRKWKKGDKRRNAATRALLYSLFFSPTTVAVTGGTVAVISLFILFWQTEAVLKQNELLQESNTQQQDQFINQRITDLTAILYDTTVNNTIGRLKSEALIEYIELKKLKNKKLGIRARVDIEGAFLAHIKIYNCNLDSINFRDVNFEGTDFINVKMNNSIFDYASFKETDMLNCEFRNSDFNGTKFGSPFSERDSIQASYITQSDFSNSKIIGANLIGSIFSECNFHRAKFSNVKIHAAEFKGSYVSIEQFKNSCDFPSQIRFNDNEIDELISQTGPCRRITKLGNIGPRKVWQAYEECFTEEHYRSILVNRRR
jgi:uncharacterized protein YjbI with pentapeptide repeats